MRAFERFLRYVVLPTQSSDENAGICTPSTEGQWKLGRLLVEELKSIGVSDARIDGKCYVYGTLPATPGYENEKALGWIAHMDTATDFSGDPVRPQLHPAYDGRDVPLGDSGRVLRTADFPWLTRYKGETLITTDGNTLLGADDKAGVAEIMTYLCEVIASGKPHGKICIGFTPDEEIEMGADYFDVSGFGADVAYTVDGEAEGEIQYENFNAAGARFTIHGVNIHPGAAKNLMKNAALIGCEIQCSLPADEIPAKTEGYEGFFHLLGVTGTVEECTLSYIVRDHDAEKFDARLALLRATADRFNEKYGAGTVVLELREQYRNMAEQIKPVYWLIDNAVKAARKVGIEPLVVPVRGGTDGARLSFMGLPCPNIGTGGQGCHGPFEFITAEAMDRIVAMMHAMTDSIYNK